MTRATKKMAMEIAEWEIAGERVEISTREGRHEKFSGSGARGLVWLISFFQRLSKEFQSIECVGFLVKVNKVICALFGRIFAKSIKRISRNF